MAGPDVTHPLYEQVRPVLPVASVLVQANPGPMTLDGTNTWLLRAPGTDEVVVVDPGQRDDFHLDRLLEVAPSIALVLVTHRHHDHAGSAAELHARTGAPVRALDPAGCHGAAALTDGLVLDAGGLRVTTLATPGHTADSVSFLLAATDGQVAGVLTGDTILGRGTTVVAYPDGDLGDYLESLGRLGVLGPLPVLPGHGPELARLDAAVEYYRAHREERLQQVRDAVVELGADATPAQVVAVVYADVDRALWPAAEISVRAQLDYLRRRS